MEIARTHRCARPCHERKKRERREGKKGNTEEEKEETIDGSSTREKQERSTGLFSHSTSDTFLLPFSFCRRRQSRVFSIFCRNWES